MVNNVIFHIPIKLVDNRIDKSILNDMTFNTGYLRGTTEALGAKAYVRQLMERRIEGTGDQKNFTILFVREINGLNHTN